MYFNDGLWFSYRKSIIQNNLDYIILFVSSSSPADTNVAASESGSISVFILTHVKSTWRLFASSFSHDIRTNGLCM